MAKKRITFLIQIGLLACGNSTFLLHAQDYHYSNLYENIFQLNPSSITQTQSATLYLNYRNQLPGTLSYVTYNAAFFYTIPSLKSTLGAHILQDNQGNGTITSSEYSFLYGYKTNISRKLTLSAGLRTSYIVNKIDISRLIFKNNQVTDLNQLASRSDFFDLSSGIELNSNENTRLGFSVSHINTPKTTTGSQLERKYNFSFIGHYLVAKTQYNTKMFIEPLVSCSMQSDFSEIVYGSRINYTILVGGLYIRQDFELNFDAFIFLLGINFANGTFIYTYDINLSGADSKFSKLAAHEVTFLINLEYNSKRKKRGAIKCPKF